MDCIIVMEYMPLANCIIIDQALRTATQILAQIPVPCRLSPSSSHAAAAASFSLLQVFSAILRIQPALSS